MKETTITIPCWNSPAGSEAKINWVTLDENGCKQTRNILEFFRNCRDDKNCYQGIFSSRRMLWELFNYPKARGIFATYQREFTYLECKNDTDTDLPEFDDLFKIAGFSLGMPVSRKKLEQMLGLENLRSLFASGSRNVFYYETWINPRYEKQLRETLEAHISMETKKMFLNCVTTETKKIISKKTRLFWNMGFLTEI